VTTDQAGAVADELRAMLVQVTSRPELLGIPVETRLFGAGVGLDSLARSFSVLVSALTR
jgi:hypothetical protein